MSVTQPNHMSSTPPRIPVGGPNAGSSTTIGPFVKSRNEMKYSVSQFAVRNSDAESINSGNASTSLSCTPMPKNPRRIAANDAPGKLLMDASTPCMKSRLSYSSSAVAFVGAPSVNSSVPRRLSTRSGVEIDRNVSAETPDSEPLIASSVIVVCITELVALQAPWESRALGHIHRHRAGDQGAAPGPGGDLDRGSAGRELGADRV